MDHQRHHEIVRIAERTGGAVTGAELRSLGVTPAECLQLVARGILHRVRRDHFLLGHQNVSRIATMRSLVLQAADGAGLSAAAAIECWGFLPWRAKVIDIAVPRRRRPVRGARLRIRRSLLDGGMTKHRGLSILVPERAVIALAEDVDSTTIVRVMREGTYRKVLDVDRLRAVTDFRGAPTIRAALLEYDTGSHGLASRFERAVTKALPPDVLRGSIANFGMDVGTEVLSVDRVWSIERICLEIDGPPHDNPVQQRIDRIRTAGLTAMGNTVVRVHWHAIERDVDAAVKPIVAIVRAAREAR